MPVKEHPVLFSSPMIRALLNTRIGSWPPDPIDPAKPCKGVTRRMSKQWLKVKAGDRLWVRETWASPEADKTKPGRVAYNADGVCGAWLWDADTQRGFSFLYHGRVLQAEGYHECFPAEGASTFGLGKYSDIRRGEHPSYRYGWRPNIHMPRWASRIQLECLEDTRAERLQDIKDSEARLEGVCDNGPDCKVFVHVSMFRELWQSLHTKPGERWEDNPTVVRVGPFRRIA